MATVTAAIASLRAGETFYAHNLGLPELREAISAYTSKLHGPVGIGALVVRGDVSPAPMLVAAGN